MRRVDGWRRNLPVRDGGFGVNFYIAILLLILMCLCEQHGYNDGRKRGKEEGYRLGRIDADKWWLGIEEQADQARQKIWREE